jgi:uncharacterized protein
MLPIIPILALAMTPPVNDKLVPTPPADVHLSGDLSRRVDVNTKRLLHVDLHPLLAGFRQKPGSHPWIGEHIGKWMHAATLAWQYERDADTKNRIREKLDYAAAELVKAQEPDGYLGTYVPEKRFGLFPDADWDVWSHKYCIIGLVTYSNATGNAPALAAARRAADLLIATFGPGRKSIITAGTHVGMASTSVIEPIVLLFNATKEQKYFDFALHVVKSYDEPNGPRLLESLLSHGDVARTANGKSYEMLSNCVGLCELYRATGDRRYLDASRNAFDSIVANQLYITGTASHHEHFHKDHDLPNTMSANVGETCVTVTWIQLCEQLLRLTGEPKYADEIERSVYNHLLAAQHPAEGHWCYYTSLDGTKPYTADTCCCLSSGPRAVSMIPPMVLLREGGSTLVVNLFEASTARLTLDQKPVSVSLETRAPRQAGATLVINPPAAGANFAVKIRMPSWAAPVTTPGTESRRDEYGWCLIPQQLWKPGDKVRIDFPIEARVVEGDFGNAGKSAVTYGPYVMCYEAGSAPNDNPAPLVWLTGELLPAVSPGGSPLVLPATAKSPRRPAEFTVLLKPIADTGVTGQRYRVWLGAPGTLDAAKFSLLCAGTESRSAKGNVEGWINDADPGSFVVTFDNSKHAEDWFAVEGTEPVEFRRVVFAHGRSFHDGGWFDTSKGPPRIEIKPNASAPWQQIGTLNSYPRTTPTDAAGLKGGEAFELKLERPVEAVAIRIVGVPACGTNTAQSFASCAELSVFSR